MALVIAEPLPMVQASRLSSSSLGEKISVASCDELVKVKRVDELIGGGA